LTRSSRCVDAPTRDCATRSIRRIHPTGGSQSWSSTWAAPPSRQRTRNVSGSGPSHRASVRSRWVGSRRKLTTDGGCVTVPKPSEAEGNDMLTGLYQAAEGMKVRLAAQDIIANNLANAGTAGFQREITLIRAERISEPASSAHRG